MKILSVTLQNLNSLTGVWSIDLTDSAFSSSGIFAITGPTGAGKSTLLDAICLALYGQTPRLGKITQKENEVMSRQTGECDAEVTFCCSGGTYTCKWHQHRSRKSPNGALQNATHEISDASGNILSKKISEVADIVEQKTGLSFERFTRSVMLAQGRFGAFLEAVADERAPILEQITGTEIYSDISKAVHERVRMEDDTLKSLQGNNRHLAILDASERAEKEAELKKIHTVLHELSPREESLQQAITWRQTLVSLEKEIGELTLKRAEIREATAAFEPKRQRLTMAQKAATLSTAYRELQIKRDQLSKTETALKDGDQKRRQTAAEEIRCQQNATALAQQLQRVKADKQAEFDIQQRVRQLDTQIKQLDKRVDDARGDLTRQDNRLTQTCSHLTRIKEEIAQLHRSTAESRAYIDAHESDSQLSQVLRAVESNIGHIETLSAHLTDKQTAHGNIDAELSRIEKEAQQHQADLSTIQTRFASIKADIEHRAQRMEAELDGVPLNARRELLRALLDQRRLTDRIVQLENERRRLKDGAPCPLCGSTHHPFADGQQPARDALDAEIDAVTQFISRMESAEAELSKCRETLTDLQQTLQRREFEAERTAQRVADLRAQQTHIASDVDRLQSQHRAAIFEFENHIAPFMGDTAQDGAPDTAPTDTLHRLKHSESLFRNAQQTLALAAPKEQQLHLAQKETATTINEIENNKASVQETLCQLDETRQHMIEERRRLYDDRSPDDEAARWQKKELDADAACQQAQSQLATVQNSRSRLDATLEKLSAEQTQYQTEYAALTADFTDKCTKAGFRDESHYADARLMPDEVQSLEAEALTLDDAAKSNDALLNNQTKRLKMELHRALTERGEAELQTELSHIKSLMARQTEALGAVKQILDDDDGRRKQASAIQKQIEAQQQTCLKWQRLHALVGSADGKKYRNFAQSLTFKRLINQANGQLSKMTDRYLLHPDENDALAFSVLDNYQGGEFRSTKNLSGGESFIVSLALALGLARMSSQKVQIDSLFLDEGFGTLDDEALDTALDTLSRLHQEGKLIGIISHVPALRERISCRIQVVPRSSGVSRLEGPGCTEGR